MFEVLTTSQVIDYLLADEYANWTYYEALALVDYYESMEDEIGEQIQFDRVAIRCDWNSYDGMEDILCNYEDIDESATLEDLRDYFGSVIMVINRRDDGTEFVTYLTLVK